MKKLIFLIFSLISVFALAQTRTETTRLETLKKTKSAALLKQAMESDQRLEDLDKIREAKIAVWEERKKKLAEKMKVVVGRVSDTKLTELDSEIEKQQQHIEGMKEKCGKFCWSFSENDKKIMAAAEDSEKKLVKLKSDRKQAQTDFDKANAEYRKAELEKGRAHSDWLLEEAEFDSFMRELGTRKDLEAASNQRELQELELAGHRARNEIISEVRSQHEGFLIELQAASTAKKLQDFKDKLEDMDDNLDEIAQYYDQTLMGAYVYEKMGKLLNSDVLCKSVTQCNGDVRKMNTRIEAKEAQEIFPHLPFDAQNLKREKWPSLPSTK